LLQMSTNYFGEGLRAKLGEFKLKYEAFAKDAGISEKTVRRAIKGEEVDEKTKQSIVVDRLFPLGQTEDY
jgi:predicted transcriptional regulator